MVGYCFDAWHLELEMHFLTLTDKWKKKKKNTRWLKNDDWWLTHICTLPRWPEAASVQSVSTRCLNMIASHPKAGHTHIAHSAFQTAPCVMGPRHTVSHWAALSHLLPASRKGLSWENIFPGWEQVFSVESLSRASTSAQPFAPTRFCWPKCLSLSHHHTSTDTGGCSFNYLAG